MTTMAKTATAACVLALAAGAWLATRSGDGTPSATHRAVVSAPVVPAPRVPREATIAHPDAAAESAAASAATRPPSPGGVRLAGRVVDERRTPVEGATVRVTRPAGESSSVSAADGRFVLDAGPPPSDRPETAGIHASVPDGRGGIASVTIGAGATGEIDAGTIAIVPSDAVRVRVTDTGEPVVGAEVWAAHWNGGRCVQARTAADGTATLAAVPRIQLTLGAYVKGRGRAYLELDADRDGSSVRELKLTSRSVRVLVVEAGSNRPRAGERIAVMASFEAIGIWHFPRYDPPLVAAPTGEDGVTTIGDVPAGDELRLVREIPGAAPRSSPDWYGAGVRVAAGATEARIEVAPTRTVRWRIVAGDVAPPAEGSILPVAWDSGSGTPLPEGLSSVRVADGVLVADAVGRGHVHAFAVAPDGSRAKLFAKDGADEGSEASFLRGRTGEVRLVERGGVPVAGMALRLHNAGNQPLDDAVVTDADGRARFEGLSPATGRVEVLGPGEWPVWFGTVDISSSDASVEWTVPAERSVVLRVTLDGVRRLPAAFKVSGSAVQATGLTEDPATAEIRFRVRPPRCAETAFMTLYGEGICAADFKVPTAGGEPVVIDLPLTAGRTLTARILLPAGVAERAPEAILLERWGASDARWLRAFVPSAANGVVPGDDGIARLGPLPPGRYRLRDRTTGACSDVVELGASDPGPLTLDLSRRGVVRGRVVAPEGTTDLASAFVRLAATGLSPEAAANPRSGVVGRDGSFAIWVPGDRPVRLTVEHPRLRTDPDSGSIEVTSARDGAVLRLVEGAGLTFRADGWDARESWTTARVLVFRGEPAGEPLAERRAPVENGRFRAAGLPSGRFTLWIDVPGFAPCVLPAVTIDADGLDLGDLPVTRGSALRVHALTATGAAAPRIWVQARRRESPPFDRFVNSTGEAEVVLAGFAPGTYDVRLLVIASHPATSVTKVVEIDGRSDATIDLDLR